MHGSTIVIHRVHAYSYFYWHTHDFGHIYIDIYAYFFPYDFLNISGSYNFIPFKNLLLYISSLIYLFVLGRDSFCTVYIYFKETIFFNFSYKLFNKHFSLPRVSVRK